MTTPEPTDLDKALHWLWLMRDWDDLVRGMPDEYFAAVDAAVERALTAHNAEYLRAKAAAADHRARLGAGTENG